MDVLSRCKRTGVSKRVDTEGSIVYIEDWAASFENRSFLQ